MSISTPGRCTQRARWSRTVALIAAACSSMLACATSWPIAPGQKASLDSGEGFLVVHLNTNAPLRSIWMGSLKAAENVPKGSHVLMIGATAGSYRWSRIDVDGSLYFSFRDTQQLRFRIEPGVINYVGMLEVQRERGTDVTIRLIDRTAMVLPELQKVHPTLAKRHPIRYTGPAVNVFLDHYLDSTAHREEAPIR